MRLDTNMVLAFKQEGWAVGAIGKAGRTRCLICVVQAVSIAIAFEAFCNTVSTATLEVTRVTSPQLTVPFIRVVLTVVVMVTDPTVGNAAQIFTTILALCACAWSAAAFIRVVTAVVVPVTPPSQRDAAVVVTAEVSVRITGQFLTALLITVVSAVVVAIANGPQRHTAVVGPTVKLCVVVTSMCRPHALL